MGRRTPFDTSEVFPGLWSHIPGVRRNVPTNCRRLVGCPALRPRELEKPRILRPHVFGWLTPYQQEGRAFSSCRDAVLYRWAPGAGKTAMAIVRDADLAPALTIVVTRANTKGQWKREYHKLTTLEDEVEVLKGQTPWLPTGRVLIINWEILPHWFDMLKEITQFAHVSDVHLILDESHRGKSWDRYEKYVDPRTYRRRRKWKKNVTATAARLSRLASYVTCLTATPAPYELMDFWAQLDNLEPEQWGSSWDFAHRYCDAKRGKYGGLDTSGRSNINELKARLATVMHTVTAEELRRSLPSKRRQLVYVSPEEQDKTSGFKRDMKSAAKAGAQNLFELQLFEAAARKRGALVDLVVDDVSAGSKVVIFTGRRRDAEDIGKALRKKVEHLWVRHGGDSQADREAAVLDYAAHEGGGCFIGTTDAFGEAVDGFQCTDHAIFALLPPTPGRLIQAEGRFSRKGQDRPVLITYLVAEKTVDEYVADALLTKYENIEELFDEEDLTETVRVLGDEGSEEEIIGGLMSRFMEE